MNETQFSKALTKLYSEKEAAAIAHELYSHEDHKLLADAGRMLKLAKGQLLADIEAYKKDRKAIEAILDELRDLKEDIDTNAFLLQVAKRLQNFTKKKSIK